MARGKHWQLDGDPWTARRDQKSRRDCQARRGQSSGELGIGLLLYLNHGMHKRATSNIIIVCSGVFTSEYGSSSSRASHILRQRSSFTSASHLPLPCAPCSLPFPPTLSPSPPTCSALLYSFASIHFDLAVCGLGRSPFFLRRLLLRSRSLVHAAPDFPSHRSYRVERSNLLD